MNWGDWKRENKGERQTWRGKIRVRETDGMRTEGKEREDTNKQWSVGDGGERGKHKKVDKEKGNDIEEAGGGSKKANANVKRKDK